jgi:uncharacterized repeat protein (TIGR01451 family)
MKKLVSLMRLALPVRSTSNMRFSTAIRRRTGAIYGVCIAAALSALGVAQSHAQTNVPFTTAGNQTWTCPTGVTSVTVQAWAGGGGGGGAGKNYDQAGGGAGGSYTTYTATVSPGTVYNLTVGAGGAGGAGGSATPTAGATGGSSFFGNSVAGVSSDASVVAVGGPGGAPINITGLSTAWECSNGGTGTASGDTPSGAAIAGGNGGTPVPGTELSGAGGAGANGGGTGGAGLTSAGTGNVGHAPGGAGSGGLQKTAATNGVGGAGAVGEIELTYTPTTPSVAVSGTAYLMYSTVGTPSAPTSFSASGINLTGNITVTAPSGFEVSTSANSGYSGNAGSLMLTPSSGTVAPTTIYVRLVASDAAGSYSGSVSVASASATAVMQSIPASTVVAAFTPGNVVVEQADNSSIQNTTVTMLELSTTVTTAQTTPVQAIPLPNSNINSSPTLSQALRINGSGGTTGYLANSNDATLLAIVDANALNNTDFTQTTAADIDNRSVVTLGGTGSLIFQAYYTGNGGVPSTGNQARGATTLDGTTWFVADKGGIYTTSSASPATTPDSTGNMLATKSFGGQVYAFSAAAPGVTLVTATGAQIGTLNALPGSLTVASYTDFYLISSGVNGAAFDICYACEGTSNTAGTITKFSLVNGSWVSNGSYTTNFGGRSIIAIGNGNGATLYLTGGTGGGTSGLNVTKVTDTAPWDSPISITTANNVNIYTFASGATGPCPKGIAFAPLASPLPDLTIAVSGSTTAPTTFDYTVTLGNSGAAGASGVAANFTLPTGLTYVSGSDNGSLGFTVANNSGVVGISGGTLGAGVTDTITVTVVGTSGSTYVIDAAASPVIAGDGAAVINTTAIAESNTNNDIQNVGVSTAVTNAPILSANVTGPSTAVANSNFNYSIALSNVGAATESGSASLAFTLPAGVTYVSGTDTGSAGFTPSFNAGPGVVTFSGGTLGSYADETLTVTVNAATSTYRIYTVSLPAGAGVLSPGNVASSGAVTTSITLPTGPDLVVTSTPGGPFQAGDSGDTFTIYVSNDGTSAETNPSVVTETLPAGLTYVSYSGAGWSVDVSGQTITATYSGAIQPGTGSTPLTITVSVGAGASGALANDLSVTSTDDAFTENGSDSNTINVAPPATYTTAGSLIVSRSHYEGSASTITAGETLPNGAAATVSGAYPYVWGDETPDVSFGVTAPIYLDVISTTSSALLSSSVTTTTNVTALISSELGENVTTSFSSKSEIGLQSTPDGTGVTFMAYLAPVNTLDVSNANTPYHDDPSSPLATHGDFQHAVVQMDYLGDVEVTPVDAYSGDNSRNAILATATDGNEYYYIVGSAGNSGASVTGSTMTMLAQCTGVQMVQPGAGGLTIAVGEPFGTPDSTTGYQLGYDGLATDKTGKDMNLRGLTLNPFNNTLYASKGSGGSGVDTLYQIGAGGLPTAANADTQVFTIPNGFPTTSSGYYPFGMYFANAYTLYVADEGEVPSPVTYDSGAGTYDQAIPANNPNAGLQKWINSEPDGSGVWSLAYVLQNGLNLGVPYPYTINNLPAGNNPVTGVPWQPANNGLRNIVARNNGDGTVTVYAVTATLSGETDFGADPNQVVVITDTISNTTAMQSSGESFSVLEEADGLDVLRGVALAQDAPIDTVASVSNLTQTGATIGGSINPGGSDEKVYIQYGTTTGYGSETSEFDLGSGSSPSPFSFNLTGLQANTTYDYRIVTVSSSGATYYANQTLTTPAVEVPAMQPWMWILLPGFLIGVAAWGLRKQRTLQTI